MRKWKLSGKLLLVMTIVAVMLISTNVQAEKVSANQGKVTYDNFTGGRVGFTIHKPDLKGYTWPWSSDYYGREYVDQVIHDFLFRVFHLNKADF